MVDQLAELVTIHTSVTMARATVIPPHMNLMDAVIEVLTQVEQTHKDMGEELEEMKESMEDVLESRVVEKGKMTPQRMLENMKGHCDKMKDLLDNKLKETQEQMWELRVASDGLNDVNSQMAEDFGDDDENDPKEVIVEQDTETERAKRQQHAHGGQFWDVPNDFSFQQEQSCAVAGNYGWLVCPAT